MPLAVLVTVAGRRWTVEERIRFTRGFDEVFRGEQQGRIPDQEITI